MTKYLKDIIKECSDYTTPKAPADRAFMNIHLDNIKKTDPLDQKAKEGNDAVFTGSNVNTYDRNINKYGYSQSEDWQHYDNFRAWRDGQLAALKHHSTGEDMESPYDEDSANHKDWMMGYTSVNRMYEDYSEHSDIQDEHEMVRTELRAIADKATHLLNHMPMGMHIEPWVQSKIANAKMEVSGVHDYLIYGDHANKPTNEETIEEKLKHSQGMGEWIKDFEQSDDPKFEGKSKSKRRQMAIAAFMSSKK